MECSLCTTFNHSVVITMTFCPECGKPVVPPSSKFCRNCGASQSEEAPLATMPALATSPVPAPAPVPAPGILPQLPQSQAPPASLQVPAEPVVRALCSACGSPVGPDEKHCGICGSPAGEHPLTIPPAPGISVPAPVSICASCGSPLPEKGRFCGVCGAGANSIAPPPPVSTPLKSTAPPTQSPSQSSGIRLCRLCGNPINPGDKFCSKCLAKVVDDSPAMQVQYQPPAPRVQPLTPLASLQVCASCGSPITGMEKFCGICGTPVSSTTPDSSAPPQPVWKTCPTCGAPISATTKFCGGCGAAVGAKSKFF